MKKIRLSNGQYAIVDSKYYPALVAMGKWTFGGRYAKRQVGRRNGKCVHADMHTVVMQLAGVKIPKGYEIDHRNRNKLDNRRKNLRVSTRAQNACNSSHRSSSCGFRGVSRYRCGGWRVRIRANGRRIWLGRFDTPEQAAREYDKAAKKLHGRFATLNFPEHRRAA